MRDHTKTRRRIGLALLLTGILALPAAPAAAAPNASPGHYLKQGHAQNAERGEKKAQRKAGKARQAQQQARQARGQARQAQQQAHQARKQAAKSQAQAHRAQARAHSQAAKANARAAAQAQARANARAAQAQARAHAQASRAQARAAEAHAARVRAQTRQAQANRQLQLQRQAQHQAQLRAQRQAEHRAARYHAQRLDRRQAAWIGARGPVYRNPGRTTNRVFAVDGYLQDDGYQCVPLRDDQGHVYILEGRVEGLRYGDHVRLVARDAPFSSCGLAGRPVVVTRVVRVWADPHHRTAFYAANVDGSFEGFIRWRDDDRWLREPRFSGYDDLDDYAAADYDYWEDGW
jgi:hypothetical protein